MYWANECFQLRNRGIKGEKQQVDVKWGDIKMGQEYLHDDSVRCST